jgi:hypothetical protein
MLAPDEIESQEAVAGVAGGVMHLSAFAESCQSATIGRLSPQPVWLDEITAMLQRTQQAAMAWFNQQPHIVPPIREAIADYQSLFDGVAQGLNPKTTDRKTWETMLGDMRDQLNQGAEAIDAAQLKLQNVYGSFSQVHDDLRDALKQAWTEHEDAHDALTQIAGHIGSLYAQLGALTQEVTVKDYESGKIVFETVADIIIPIFKAGEAEISFMSIGLSLFSVGVSLYSSISGNEEINQTISELREALNEQSDEIQALAATNAALELLDALDQSYLDVVKTRVPQMSSFLRGEASKIGAVLGSFNDPSSNGELLTLNAAKIVWDQLAALAQQIGAGAGQDGGTIVLSPGKQIAQRASGE